MTSQPTQRHPLSQLDFTSRVRKRAQYEAFEFTLISDGVLVRNESYADPENHEYRIKIRDGIPMACTCPADTKFDGACKHRVAVAIRRPILSAVHQLHALADGGASGTEPADTDEPTPEGTQADQPSESEDCAECQTLGDLPCWECARTRGR